METPSTDTSAAITMGKETLFRQIGWQRYKEEQTVWTPNRHCSVYDILDSVLCNCC